MSIPYKEIAEVLGTVIGLARHVAKEQGPAAAWNEIERMTGLMNALGPGGSVDNIDPAEARAELEALSERLMHDRADADDILAKRFAEHDDEDTNGGDR